MFATIEMRRYTITDAITDYLCHLLVYVSFHLDMAIKRFSGDDRGQVSTETAIVLVVLVAGVLASVMLLRDQVVLALTRATDMVKSIR